MVDEQGGVETLGETAARPFWVEGLGWIPAGVLEAADELYSSTGERVQVRGLTWRETRQTVYNLEVADDHTYFVGECGVWVGNRP